MSICEETKEALPGILSSAAESIPTTALRGASFVTSKGVVLYEAVIDGKDLVLAFGHLPFGEMIQAICAFLNAENAAEEALFLPEALDHQHAIVRDLNYRRITLPEDPSSYDVSTLSRFGGHTPVTVWSR